jgi:ABC-type polysaccharide/polyol phosphate transport system ATPase subunit
MSKIVCKQVSLSYPIYDLDKRSFKRNLASIATGGLVVKDTKGLVKINALQNINLHLKEGDRVGLIGHNGAGKSTFLRLLSGVYEPEQGNIHVEGKVSSLLNINVGMQPTLTGYENIRIRGLLMGLSPSKIQSVITDIENFTELGNFLSMQVKTYSTGMSIRLAFALSTAIEPDILLVDEVIGAGDANFLEKAKKRMHAIIQKSNIMVLASHSNDIITQFCNRVLWLEHGQIKLDGPAEEVIQAYKDSLIAKA